MAIEQASYSSHNYRGKKIKANNNVAPISPVVSRSLVTRDAGDVSRPKISTHVNKPNAALTTRNTRPLA
ncbi:MAG: hypothetical protein ABSB83_03330 [Methanomassiliicoccales archaeon]